MYTTQNQKWEQTEMKKKTKSVLVETESQESQHASQQKARAAPGMVSLCFVGSVVAPRRYRIDVRNMHLVKLASGWSLGWRQGGVETDFETCT